ncbi:MAG TPA: putative zinc-binding peptidase [Vicinamibacterales bacterium]|nr:putative zinc-binding peptidase [Vicinamibacterales bacterium]
MKVFHCDHCGQLLFFENTVCLSCKRRVAYLPDLGVVGSLDQDPADPERWRSPLPKAPAAGYRLCRNYAEQEVCNWTVPDDEPGAPLCLSCRLTRVIPDLTQPGVKVAWYKLETAKRRLVYTIANAQLPIRTRDEDPAGGLAFEFLADPPEGGPPVLTGHADGVITINIAEADDAEREKRRTAMHEPYRTLLGHVRHEIGHYYWDRLILHPGGVEAFRAVFGDERQDYAGALEAHYRNGAPADWQDRFVSAYASAHPWEDWAETWAHYLHIIDTLEMAAHCGLSLRPRRSDEPSLPKPPPAGAPWRGPFERLIEDWLPVAYVLNNLNRGLGQPDGYPFVLSPAVIGKLRYVHELVEHESRNRS